MIPALYFYGTAKDIVLEKSIINIRRIETKWTGRKSTPKDRAIERIDEWVKGIPRWFYFSPTIVKDEDIGPWPNPCIGGIYPKDVLDLPWSIFAILEVLARFGEGIPNLLCMAGEIVEKQGIEIGGSVKDPMIKYYDEFESHMWIKGDVLLLIVSIILLSGAKKSMPKDWSPPWFPFIRCRAIHMDDKNFRLGHDVETIDFFCRVHWKLIKLLIGRAKGANVIYQFIERGWKPLLRAVKATVFEMLDFSSEKSGVKNALEALRYLSIYFGDYGQLNGIRIKHTDNLYELFSRQKENDGRDIC